MAWGCLAPDHAAMLKPSKIFHGFLRISREPNINDYGNPKGQASGLLGFQVC